MCVRAKRAVNAATNRGRKQRYHGQMAAKLANLDILRDMPAPLSTGGARPESHAWQELEDVFSALGQLARSPTAPLEFYRTVLDQSVRALSAAGGVVWLRAS